MTNCGVGVESLIEILTRNVNEANDDLFGEEQQKEKQEEEMLIYHLLVKDPKCKMKNFENKLDFINADNKKL